MRTGRTRGASNAVKHPEQASTSSLTVAVVDPLDGSLFPVHIHRLPFTLHVLHVTQRVRDPTCQLDLILDRGMRRRVEVRGREHFS